MENLRPSDFICMNDYVDHAPILIDLAYARDDNLLFGQRIYRSDAQLWLYKDLAKIILNAAQSCFDSYGCRMILYDGLRTIEAQAKMLETRRVQDNPQWLSEPRLLSPPGSGGHPRGMAVDCSLVDEAGTLVDMGTPFDFLAENSSAEKNPAHRDYPKLSENITQNRFILYNATLEAGAKLLEAREVAMPITGLPQEWWDFRAPAEFYERFAPLSDDNLPAEMRMI